MKLFFLLASIVVLAHGRPDDFKTSPQLLRALKGREADTVNIFISFREGTEEVLDAIVDTRFDTRGDRLWALHDNLINHAARVQSGVKLLLQGRFEFTSLWITNQIYIKGATMDLVIDLAARPEIKALDLEEIVELNPIYEGPVIRATRFLQETEEWGIRKIQSKEARELLTNASINAAPIVISTIDTGARHTHEALRGNWLGDYGWFDPYDRNALPMDINGHGTHTTGTICGAGGIGVYPQAKWTSCRGCATSSCAQNALLECAQFIACPTKPDGSSPDCTKAPNLVSNSWGGGRGATWFDGAIAAFHAAKIIPLFSIGNSGPSCNTANSPGDRNVIGVGSTTEEDGLSSFSSVGPTIDGKMKPDISAPGSNVLSAYNTADDAYRALSGTSMACPHAAGLTALLLAHDPDMTYDQVTSHIRAGVDTDSLVSGGKTCDGFPDHTFPNHHHGSGRINAFKSLRGAMTGK